MGLGKGNDGITTHVVVNKKDESEGVSAATRCCPVCYPRKHCVCPPRHATDWLQQARELD